MKIIGVSHFTWRLPDGKLVPRTRVTWRDDRDQLRSTVLEGTLRDEAELERRVRRAR